MTTGYLDATRRLRAAATVRWRRRLPGSWLRSPRRAALIVVGVALLWPLPNGDAGWQLARAVGAEWVSCAVNDEPPPPEWRRALRQGVDDRGIDADWVSSRLGDDVPPQARLVSPRRASQPEYDPDRLTPDHDLDHPRVVVVAVIDSGVAGDHPEVDTVMPGLDLVAPCGDGRTDVTGHGTAVAGVIASQTHGAAPFVQILPARISLPDGRHTPLHSAAAIAWAVRRDVDLINLSYTNQDRGRSWLEHRAIRWAQRRDVGMIAAAGNDASEPVGYPAAYPEVLAVGSIDPGGQMSAFSARRPRRTGVGLDVVAPGARIVTLSPDGRFHVASGTSLAAPVATATAASLLLEDEQLTGRQAVERLRSRPGGPVAGFDEPVPR